MKYILSLIFTLIMSFNLIAKPGAADQQVVDMLLSGELSQLKVAAQTINNNKISDPAVIDIAAEILLKKYPSAYPSEIDTLAWLARAIGSSENGRYYDVFSQVLANSTNRKLIKHVKKAQKNLNKTNGQHYLVGMYQLPDNLYKKEDDATRDQRITSLLLAGDLPSLKQGAKAIVETKTQNLALTDITAEILITHYADAQKHQIDTFAWLTNAIGQSGSGRYIDVLTQVEQNATNRKLRKYAKKALKALEKSEDEQYQKGMLGREIASYEF